MDGFSPLKNCLFPWNVEKCIFEWKYFPIGIEISAPEPLVQEFIGGHLSSTCLSSVPTSVWPRNWDFNQKMVSKVPIHRCSGFVCPLQKEQLGSSAPAYLGSDWNALPKPLNKPSLSLFWTYGFGLQFFGSCCFAQAGIYVIPCLVTPAPVLLQLFWQPERSFRVFLSVCE